MTTDHAIESRRPRHFPQPAAVATYQTAGGVDIVALSAMAFFIVGVYLNITIFSGLQPIVPSVISVAAAVVYLALRWDRVSWHELLFIGYFVILVAALYLITSTTHGGFSKKSFNGTGNIIISWIVCYIAFTMIRANDRRANAWLFAAAWGLLLIGAYLELTGPLRGVSDAFRLRVYRFGYIYSDTTRDIDLYGGYRPKVFASEPSLVGVWFSVTLCAWLLLYPVKLWSRRTLIFFGAIAAMIYAERSPTILFCLPVFAFGLYSQGSESRRVGRPLQYISLAVTAGGVLLVGALLNAIPQTDLPHAFQGGSFYYRMIAPAGLAAQIVGDFPLFGIGLGNQELLADESVRFFMGHYTSALNALSNQVSILNIVANGFYLQLIYAGIVGSVVLGGASVLFLRRLQIEYPAAVLACWMILINCIGGFVTMQTWAIFFIFAGVRYAYETERAHTSM